MPFGTLDYFPTCESAREAWEEAQRDALEAVRGGKAGNWVLHVASPRHAADAVRLKTRLLSFDEALVRKVPDALRQLTLAVSTHKARSDSAVRGVQLRRVNFAVPPKAAPAIEAGEVRHISLVA